MIVVWDTIGLFVLGEGGRGESRPRITRGSRSNRSNALGAAVQTPYLREDPEKKNVDYCEELNRPRDATAGTELEHRSSVTSTCTPAEPTRKAEKGRTDRRTDERTGRGGIQSARGRELRRSVNGRMECPARGRQTEVREVVQRVQSRRGGRLRRGIA